MAAGVDKILLISFDFWQYGSGLINQMKIKDDDKPEEKGIFMHSHAAKKLGPALI
ncbi:MAG: hypothetical protein JRG68_04960 [Deltaproteobacteria bacterium]|nr:hypothetical protein [Deltaproteobacteria bacterium]MBW2100104.1 hypothetical protein [Deltaproteobacteria bacterium]